MTEQYCILNGSLIPIEEARISPLNRAFMYGDSCFDTLKAEKGKFLHWDEHFSRLSEGLNYLGIQQFIEKAQLKELVINLLNKNELQDDSALVRIQGWRNGERGYGTQTQDGSYIIIAKLLNTDYKLVKLATSQVKALPEELISRKYKLGNAINFIIAANEAMQKNADDALLLTQNGFVAETTISNIFWLKNSTFYTPDESCDLLPGITRAIILKILNEKGCKVETGKYELEHLYDAEAVFCCNSVREMVEVQSIDDNQFKIRHPFISKLKLAFDEYKNSNLRG